MLTKNIPSQLWITSCKKTEKKDKPGGGQHEGQGVGPTHIQHVWNQSLISDPPKRNSHLAFARPFGIGWLIPTEARLSFSIGAISFFLFFFFSFFAAAHSASSPWVRLSFLYIYAPYDFRNNFYHTSINYSAKPHIRTTYINKISLYYKLHL